MDRAMEAMGANGAASLYAYRAWDPRRTRRGNRKGGAVALHDPENPRVQLAGWLGVLGCMASSLRYLHEECRIDIKPNTIGFYRRVLPRRMRSGAGSGGRSRCCLA